MDEQNQQPASHQNANPQLAPSAQTAAANNQQDKPELNVPDKAAQAILAINNLQAKQTPKTKPPIKLLVAALALIVLIVLSSFLLGAFKPGSGSKSSNPVGGLGLPNQSDPTNGSDTSNQINQDVKACSNPFNAVTVC